MNANKVIIWLTLQLTVVSFFWLRAEKKLSWYEGRESIYQDVTQAIKDDLDPPYDNSQPKKPIASKAKERLKEGIKHGKN